MTRTRDYRQHLDDVLKDDAEAVAYLNAALAKDDPEVFLLALRDVARTREGGLAGLAETAQLNREHLYRMLSENGNPCPSACATGTPIQLGETGHLHLGPTGQRPTLGIASNLQLIGPSRLGAREGSGRLRVPEAWQSLIDDSGKEIQNMTTKDAESPVAQRSMTVQIWAFVGFALLILQLYVWFQWITGPYFVPVPTGVSDPPMYMKVFLSLNAGVLALGLPFAIWYFWIKPWRQERKITLDGILMLSTGLMVFQDPLLNYFNTWCTYNTWLWNWGAWTSHIPGWSSPEEPGRMVAEPVVNNFIGYSYGVLLTVMLGCWVMGKIKQRWPNISNLRLIGLTYAYSILFDFVMEGLILLPFGLYTYPGAIRALSINAGTYYQYPIYEGFMWGGVETALCCLRYFTDSRGRTLVERGIDDVGGGFVRQQMTRFLAIFAAVSASFFFIYMVPAQWLGMHAEAWPEDVQKRSYFIGGICGEGTDKLCPHPLLPVPTKKSGYVDKDGRFILPEGAEMPKMVPFERSGE